jgi:hypothetical protein
MGNRILKTGAWPSWPARWLRLKSAAPGVPTKSATLHRFPAKYGIGIREDLRHRPRSVAGTREEIEWS